jgi:hypothetical protein
MRRHTWSRTGFRDKLSGEILDALYQDWGLARVRELYLNLPYNIEFQR